jgi:hypothetical protein
MVDRLKIMRKRVQKTRAAAIHAGVVAVGDCKNVGVLLGSTEKSARRNYVSLTPSTTRIRIRTIDGSGGRGGTVN